MVVSSPGDCCLSPIHPSLDLSACQRGRKRAGPNARIPPSSLAKRKRGSWHGPQGCFLWHCRMTGRKRSNDLRNRCMKLNRNCWKSWFTSCGTIKKSLNLGDRETRVWNLAQRWKPCSVGSGTSYQSPQNLSFPTCKVETVGVLISKVEICTIG